MQLDDSVLGLIPARGGSKSIPLKNLAPLAGKPLIEYVARAALASRRLSRIVCSSDHPRIAETCAFLGIQTIDRPPDLSLDSTPIIDVIFHVLQQIALQNGSAPGMVVLLQPTSPFILPAHIDACVEVLNKTPEAHSAQTIIPVPHNAHAFNQRIIENGFVRFRFVKERQAGYNKQLKPKHYLFGNLVVTRSSSLLKNRDCFGAISIPVEISRLYSLDVDTLEDLDYADYLVRYKGLADYDQRAKAAQ